MITLHDVRFDQPVECPEGAYVLDVALAHMRATRPSADVTDLVMHPALAESDAGGCERVRAWCAANGIRACLTEWAPRDNFGFANLDQARIDAETDRLHTPWIEPFNALNRYWQ